jgi:hypothetical protein
MLFIQQYIYEYFPLNFNYGIVLECFYIRVYCKLINTKILKLELFFKKCMKLIKNLLEPNT